MEEVDIPLYQLSADNPVSTQVSIPAAIDKSLSIGNISYNAHDLFSSGNFSQLFAGTLGEKSVAVEKIPAAYVDSGTVAWLLNLNNMNVVKVLHAEHNPDFKYAN